MKNRKNSFWKQILLELLIILIVFLAISLFTIGVLNFYISVSIIVAALIFGGAWMMHAQEKERSCELEKLQRGRKKV